MLTRPHRLTSSRDFSDAPGKASFRPGKTERSEVVVTKNTLHRLKGFGYLTSSVSVFLLATVSWSSEQKSTLLTACVIAGAANVDDRYVLPLAHLRNREEKRTS